MVLKDYMRSVYELELNKYEQNRMLQMLYRRLDDVKHPKLVQQEESLGVMCTIFILVFICIALLLSPIIGIVVGFLLYLIVLIFINIPATILAIFFDSKILDFLQRMGKFKGYIKFWKIAIPIIFCVIAGIIVISLIVSSISGKRFNKSATERNSQIWDLSDMKATHINELISRQKNLISQTESVLNKYYGMCVLHRDYWGLVPVSTIYSYLEKGICAKLEGHEGAYLLYENELRWNKVFSKLDDIIYRLDSIESNQQMLARAIKSSNDKIDRLQSSLTKQLNDVNGNLERINTSQQISNYFNAVAAINSSYLVKLQNNR